MSRPLITRSSRNKTFNVPKSYTPCKVSIFPLENLLLALSANSSFRLLHARIMLYRPFFGPLLGFLSTRNAVYKDRDLQQSSNNPNTRDVVRSLFSRHCAVTCIGASGELIETLRRIIIGRFFGAWWYGLYCMRRCPTPSYAGKMLTQ